MSKRRAEKQLTDTNWQDADQDEGNESVDSDGPFKRADDRELSGRKIRKLPSVRRGLTAPASGAAPAFGFGVSPSPPPGLTPSSLPLSPLDANLQYYMSLRGLNVSLISHLQSVVDKDPFADLSTVLASALPMYTKERTGANAKKASNNPVNPPAEVASEKGPEKSVGVIEAKATEEAVGEKVKKNLFGGFTPVTTKVPPAPASTEVSGTGDKKEEKKPLFGGFGGFGGATVGSSFATIAPSFGAPTITSSTFGAPKAEEKKEEKKSLFGAFGGTTSEKEKTSTGAFGAFTGFGGPKKEEEEELVWSIWRHDVGEGEDEYWRFWSFHWLWRAEEGRAEGGTEPCHSFSIHAFCTFRLFFRREDDIFYEHHWRSNRTPAVTRWLYVQTFLLFDNVYLDKCILAPLACFRKRTGYAQLRRFEDSEQAGPSEPFAG
ncbi:hypothetical protein BT69DRAFT_149717 [Atractiella rhizophila]|nr:hypothetical protein BT69DRAFT_149717 [Atractiella rhizophila]